MDELETLSKPMIEYLKKNYHPHTAIVITGDKVAVWETALSIPMKSSDSAIAVNLIQS